MDRGSLFSFPFRQRNQSNWMEQNTYLKLLYYCIEVLNDVMLQGINSPQFCSVYLHTI